LNLTIIVIILLLYLAYAAKISIDCKNNIDTFNLFNAATHCSLINTVVKAPK